MTRELKMLLGLTISGVLVVLGFRFLFPLFAPFLIGLMLACWVEPLVAHCEAQFRIQRGIIIGVILLLFTLITLAITGITVVALYQEAEYLLPKIPLLVDRCFQTVDFWLQTFSRLYSSSNQDFGKITANPESFSHLFRSIIIWMMGLLPKLPNILFAVVLGGVTAFFLSRDKNQLNRLVYRLFPCQWVQVIADLKQDVLSTIAGYLRVELTLALNTGVLTAIALKGLGVPGAFAYGVLAGILDLIPVLGPGLIYFPIGIVYLLFDLPAVSIWLLITYSVIVLVRQFAELKLVGSNLRVHPLLSLFVIYVGMKIFGFAGFLYGPIILIMLRSIYRSLAVILQGNLLKQRDMLNGGV